MFMKIICSVQIILISKSVGIFTIPGAKVGDVLACPLLEPFTRSLPFQLLEEGADLEIPSAKGIFRAVLSKEAVRVPPPQVELDNSRANHDVPEKCVLAFCVLRRSAAHADEEGDLYPLEARVEMCRHRGGADLSHARHVRQHDVLFPDTAGGVGVEVPRGFPVGEAIDFEFFVQESFDGIAFLF